MSKRNKLPVQTKNMRMVRSLKIFLYVIVPLIILVVGGFATMIIYVGGGMSSPTIDEVLRVTSPNQKLDAVFISENYHSTVPYVGKLFIVLRNHSVQNEEEYLRITKFSDINLYWQNDTNLRVDYNYGVIHNFTNIYRLPTSHEGKILELYKKDTTVEIVLNKLKR